MENNDNQTNEEIEPKPSGTEVIELVSENEVKVKPKRKPRNPKEITIDRNPTEYFDDQEPLKEHTTPKPRAKSKTKRTIKVPVDAVLSVETTE